MVQGGFDGGLARAADEARARTHPSTADGSSRCLRVEAANSIAYCLHTVVHSARTCVAGFTESIMIGSDCHSWFRLLFFLISMRTKSISFFFPCFPGIASWFHDIFGFTPFRTPVPFWGQTTYSLSALSPHMGVQC